MPLRRDQEDLYRKTMDEVKKQIDDALIRFISIISTPMVFEGFLTVIFICRYTCLR